MSMEITMTLIVGALLAIIFFMSTGDDNFKH